MNKENFKSNIIPILISTVIITILYNLKLVAYSKYFLLPMMLLIITCIYLINKNNMVINNKAYRFLIPIILIVLGTVIFKADISNKLLNIIIIPILTSMLFFGLTNKHYQISGKFFRWFFKLFPANLFSNLEVITSNVKINSSKKKKYLHILVGILISLPLIYTILLLLISADIYFDAFIGKILYAFKDWFLDLRIIRNNIIIFAIYFIILFSTFVNIIKNKEAKVELGKPKKIEVTLISPALIMMNLVFLLFLLSEISKITTNFLQLPITYTYSEYAREGFFQLLAVTVINYTVILLLLYKTNLVKENKLLKYLVLALVIFTIILIFNSYYRMFLYINRFGFTILRMQVVLFLLMELIISGIVIKKILTKLKHPDAKTYMIISTCTYVINIFICNQLVIDLINKLIHK